MKIVFAGTPQFAVAPLKALISAGFEVASVLTQPDKPQGRKQILTPSPVKLAAQEAGIPVLQPAKLKEDFSALASVGADAMVTCAYGQILTQAVLDIFPKGVWNVHASLLPAYRGAAPIPRAIIEGETETGVTIMKTDVGLDTGDILFSRAIPIAETDTCGTLSEKLSALGAEAIVQAVRQIAQGNVTLTPQGEGFVCKKVQKQAVDFSRSAKEVSRLIRGLSPSPLAYGKIGDTLLHFYGAEALPWAGAEACGAVLSDSPKTGLIVKCGTGAVKITELQPAGGKRMPASAFLNGKKLAKGACFEKQPVL